MLFHISISCNHSITRLISFTKNASNQRSILPVCGPKVGIFKQYIGARNRGGMGLSYRAARLHRLAELIPRNQFLGSINV